MSGQKQRDRGMDSLARSMDDTIDGERIDLQDVARAVNSGRVEAEGQQLPQDEIKQASIADDESDDQPS